MSNNFGGSKRLGRGLNALLGDAVLEDRAGAQNQGVQVVEIDINRLDPNQDQPRQDFDEEKLQELSQSIAIHGVIQPILVARGGAGRYTIIAGERRWRAARLAGLKAVPAIIRDYEKQQLMEVSLIENMQRADLNPLEEAEAMRLLMDMCQLTQESLAQRLGKSRPAVANTLRILSLPQSILDLVREQKITAGHARALLGCKDQARQQQLARQIVQEGLSVRQTEKLAQQPPVQKRRAEKEKAPDLVSAESRLRQALGTKVSLQGDGKRGKVVIEYYTVDDLNRIFERICPEEE